MIIHRFEILRLLRSADCKTSDEIRGTKQKQSLTMCENNHREYNPQSPRTFNADIEFQAVSCPFKTLRRTETDAAFFIPHFSSKCSPRDDAFIRWLCSPLNI